ncbi:hypothetical protein Egran_05308 [Elaphomyces granulatus]|uniref:Uncharacterized protein n=1 Tax=Elaphomyces granulatus TaxID=519963 RepID=A0A232LS65_9EURO|nr:hypothetical protein Egran_05308 [Elaphomyces granulatus]
MPSPPPVRPEAAFIAASAASQIIIAEARNEINWDSEDENLANVGSAVITPTSLSLLNDFLDHLLFNILAAAKSTQLSALRPAIADTLKPRLAKEVVSIADEELGEYMGGGEDEELQEFRGGQEPRGEFDLIRSWRLTRLRCMVYTRLGDMEEEDEDEYVEREGLNEINGTHLRFSSHIGNITPAAAIFLTSIIEYLGENALGIAGEAARTRLLSVKASNDGKEPGESHVGRKNRLMVEDTDMEKVALNPTLGRLWRTWRKCIKGPGLSRTLSRESFFRRGHYPTVASSRKSSFGTTDSVLGRDPPIEPAVEDNQERMDPAAVALPMTENDVAEIEVPGLAHDFDSDVETREATIAVARRVRPRSLIISATGLLTPISSNGDFPSTPPLTGDAHHKRPRSLPNPDNPLLVSVGASDNIGREPLTPFEEPMPLETTYGNIKAESCVAFPSTLDTTQVSELPEPIEPVVFGEELAADVDSQAQAADASVEIATEVPSNDNDISGDDPCNENVQVIEGQGTVERPKKHAISAQRLRRKPNRDLSQVGSESSMNSDVTSQLSADQEYLVQGSVVVDDSASTPSQSSVNSSPRIVSSNSPRHERSRPPALPLLSPARHPEVSCTPLPPVGEEIDPPECLERCLSNEADSSSRRSRSTGAQPSNSEDSDSSHRIRQSRSKSQNGSGRSQFRHGQPDLSPGAERAAVQRVPSPLPTPTDLTISKSRRSGSISSAREKRPLTAGSAASTVSTKLKGLIGRHHGETDNMPPLPPRSSSDASRRSSDATSDDKSNLDKLIKSNETLRYTLTPRNMREMEAPGSPRWNAALAEPEVPYLPKDVIPPGEGLQRTKSTGANSDRTNGLRSHPVSELRTPRPESSYVPSSIPISPRTIKPKAYQARDPRPVAESTREFADFIRSTGPTFNSHVSRTGSLQRRATSASVVSSKRADTPTSISRPTTRGTETRKTGPRLQARPAVTNEGNQTSDLIDFIREGPPMAGTHRIPRNVAPFRTTMDSDELQSLDTTRITKALLKQDSIASTQGSSTQANSLYSSDSRSGLLEPTNASGTSTLSSLKSRAAPPAAVTLKAFAGNDDMTPRTYRRVRDPYAIDSDDEDFDDSRPKIPKEESLMDFLRSVPPPPGNDRPPLPFSINTPPPKSAGRNSSIASSMKSRLKRDTSLDHKSSFSSLRSRTSNHTSVDSIAAASIPSSPISASALSNKSPFESYTVAKSGYSEHVNRQRNGGAISGARIPVSGSHISHREAETSSLADFLRNTEPPKSETARSSMLSGSTSSSKDFAGNSFTRFFSRRKKLEV